MFFSLLKWWMLKRRWKIGNTVKVQPLGNLDSIQLRDDLQNWLDFLLSSASLDKSSPSSTQETQIHPTMEHIQEVQDWRWFKCQMSQAQFEWCHFQILWNYVCVYIYTSQYSSIFLLQDGILNAFLIPSIFCLFGDMRLQGLKVAQI